MRIFTQFIKYMGLIYILIGCVFSALGYIYPGKFLAGEPLNEAVFKSSIYAFWLLGILCVVYWIKFKPADEIVVNYSRVQCLVYIILLINGAFCLFSGDGMLENGLSTTYSKLMTGLAVIMMFGFFAYTGAQNVLKSIISEQKVCDANKS